LSIPMGILLPSRTLEEEPELPLDLFTPGGDILGDPPGVQNGVVAADSAPLGGDEDPGGEEETARREDEAEAVRR